MRKKVSVILFAGLIIVSVLVLTKNYNRGDKSSIKVSNDTEMKDNDKVLGENIDEIGEITDNQEIDNQNVENKNNLSNNNQSNNNINSSINNTNKVSSEENKNSGNNTNGASEEENKSDEDKKGNQQVTPNDNSDVKNDDTVDEKHFDYPTHKGRIDCYSADECFDLSFPILLKFNNNIANAFYIDVMSKNNNSLGYFIEYVFKDANYEIEEDCNSIGEQIKLTLINKVKRYECINKDNNYILKIYSDY